MQVDHRIDLYFCQFFPDFSCVKQALVYVHSKPLSIHIDLQFNHSLVQQDIRRGSGSVFMVVSVHITAVNIIAHKKWIVICFGINIVFDMLAANSHEDILLI